MKNNNKKYALITKKKKKKKKKNTCLEARLKEKNSLMVCMNTFCKGLLTAFLFSNIVRLRTWNELNNVTLVSLLLILFYKAMNVSEYA